MRHWRIWLFLVAITAIFGFCIYSSLPVGVGMPGNVEPTAVSQNETPNQPATAVAQVTSTATLEATQAPVEEPTQTAVIAPEQANYCVDCHTDKEQLIDTAAPEEVVVKESEGAG